MTCIMGWFPEVLMKQLNPQQLSHLAKQLGSTGSLDITV